MKVTLQSSCLVKPLEATWNGRMPLTESDQINVITHIPTIYLYKPHDHKDDTVFGTTLKTSLSEALVHFYPLAGRLAWLEGSRLELDCNAEGVAFIEASCDSTIDELEDITNDKLQYLSPQIDYKAPIEEMPLLVVQLTKFACGGLTLSLAISHAVVDGQSALYFYTEWARIARGEPLSTPPFHDRKALRAGDPPPPPPAELKQNPFFEGPPLLIGESSTESESKKKTSVAKFKLSKIQVEMLKNEANRDHDHDSTARPYSRFEALTGHLWRSVTTARGHQREQKTGIGMAVDVRRRVQPPLPAEFFGNAICDVVARALSGDLVEKPLGYAAERIREAISSATNEYAHLIIDFFKRMEDLSMCQDIHRFISDKDVPVPFFGNPNMGVVSWMGLPMHGFNFGWGKEIRMLHRNPECDGNALIYPGEDGDGSYVVHLCLQTERMEYFKKYFYQDI